MEISSISNINFSNELIKPPLGNSLSRLYKIFVAALFIYCAASIINKQLKKGQIKLPSPSLVPFTKQVDLLTPIKLANTKRWKTIYSTVFQQDVEWKQNAVKLLRQSYYEDPTFEIARLEGGILKSERHAQINQALDKLAIYPPSPLSPPQPLSTTQKPWGKVMIGRALEIKTIFSQTHHIFTHAQSTQWFALILAKELLKRQKPHRNFKSMKYLRDMQSFEKEKAIGDKLENMFKSLSKRIPRVGNWVSNTSLGRWGAREISKLKKKPETLQEFLKRQLLFNDEQGEQRIKLLSVSGYLLDTAPYESALHFLMSNNNILNDASAVAKVMHIMLKGAFPKFEETILYAYADQITQAMPKGNYPCGNLFVICIPKEKCKDIVYRAHPYGSPCNCYPKEEDERISEKVQKGKIEDSITCKESKTHQKIPQYRIFLPQLENHEEEQDISFKEKDEISTYQEKIRIFRISPIPKEVRSQAKVVVRNILDALFAQLEQIR